MAGAAPEAHQGQWERLTPARLLSPGAVRAQACQHLDFGKRRAQRREKPVPRMPTVTEVLLSHGLLSSLAWVLLGQTHQGA